MESILRGLLVLATAGTIAFPTQPPKIAASSPAARQHIAAPWRSIPPQTFAADQIEAYLTAETVDYIRPGLNINVKSITNVAPGQHPVVEILITDDLGQPLDRTGGVTPGAIEVDFVLAQWDATNYDYVNLTTASFGPVTYPLHDSGGTWSDVAVGDSKYTFAQALPANFDVTQTLTLGVYSTRRTKDIVGKDYNAPAAFMDFRPDGGKATAVFAAINTASCNKCHDPISMHGQFGPPVQDVKLCVMCHTSQMPVTQTGESLNFKVMLHRIHDGANLPSVQAGTPYIVSPGADFSTVVFPQDIRNCATCHDPKAPDAAIWYTNPNRAACGSCHDNINWTTGANHPGGQQINDSSCANCHEPTAEAEYDASVPGAHTIEYKSQQLHGLTMKILSVTQAKPGQAPIVKFQINDKNGAAIDPRPIDTLRFTLGGPTTDYSTYYSEDALPTVTFDGTTSTYTFVKPIPATATGTWMLTCDVEWTVNIKRGDGKPDITSFTESPANPIFYIAMTDPAPVPRRTVVDINNCNTCHDRIAAHGGQRLLTQGCVVCHNPTSNDGSRRPAAAGPPESISFQRMIHRIHTGENLTQDYTIYGFGNNAHTFNGVRFSGDRRNCAKCHTDSTYALPTGGTLSVVTLRDFFSPQGPGTAACLGCHDNVDSAAHAYLNTTNFGVVGKSAEACATCHGTGKDWDVAKVHAR